MKRILVLDGGGVKGIMQSAVLRAIELKTGKLISEIFDLIVGTSVGAITGGAIASGMATADKLHEESKKAMGKIFRRTQLLAPIYDRKRVLDVLDKHIPAGMLMEQCRTKFMCTADNLCTGRPHFFKSWEKNDGKLVLTDAIERSFSAPYYFGEMDDESSGAVWLDGGTGIANCPVLPAYAEAFKLGWAPGNQDKTEQLHILSIGCGHKNSSVPFDKAKKYRSLRQLGYYMSPADGGRARLQAVYYQVSAMQVIADNSMDLTFQRIDREIPSKMDAMDKVKYIDKYEEYGVSLSKTVDYKLLKA